MTAPAVRHWADVYVDELHERAGSMKAFGDDRGATMCAEVAREIAQRRTAYEDEQLTAVQGARESGFSEQRLRELKKEGKWSGRRRDLPRHPGLQLAGPALVGDRQKEASGQLSVSIADRVGRGNARGHTGRSRKRSRV